MAYAGTAPVIQEGEVATGVLNVRSGPGPSYRIIGKVLKGCKVKIHDMEDEWLKVSVGELEGYISRKHVLLIPLETPATDSTPEPDPATSGTFPEEEEDPPPFNTSLQPEDLQEMETDARRIEGQISEHEAQVSKYTEKEAALIDELDQLGRQLNQTKHQVKETRETIASIEAARQETEKEIASLEAEIDILDDYAAKRLVALYKLHQLGKMPVLASSDSIFDLLNRKNALERIMSADKALWDDLTLKKSRAEALGTQLSDQKRQHAETLVTLNDQLSEMTRQNQARTELLGEIRGKKSLMLAAIDSLKEAAFALDKQMDGDLWEIHSVGPSQGADNKKPFQELKGLLQPPVPGKITAFYGLTKSGSTESENYKNGIEILAEPGEPIHAIHGGTVIYADWFRGYGNLIIIDHGNDYCTIYAHAEELFKAAGDPVDPDEVIGTVGDTGSLAGTKLYFEIRHEGKPIDPLAWLNRN
jgi:septal ring factor EnvC (AmiA/AmiB activator)